MRGSTRAPSGRRFFARPGAFSASISTTPKCTAPIGRRSTTKYRPLLPFVGHRADLGYLIATVGGELTVGHSYLTGAGDVPSEDPVSVGLLGADFAIENGRYRIKQIYTGENWNPDLRAPLSAPGIQVAEGDYLLEVNGRPLAPPTNLYQLFRGHGRTADADPGQQNALAGRLAVVTVVPVASEDGLRTRAWIEDNRRLVDKLSGGRLAYVWLPNTGVPGYTSFTRYYYSQQDKEGAIIDERYNQGGMVADYIVNELDRKLMGYFAQRDGKPSTSPIAGIYGPKVMIINESAGSGGDALPYYFRQRSSGRWSARAPGAGWSARSASRRRSMAAASPRRTRVLRSQGRVGRGERGRRAGHRGRDTRRRR